MIWTDLDGPGMEHLKLTRDEDGYLADGMYVGRNGGGGPYRLQYEIRIDPSWQMRSLELNMVEGPEGAGKIALTVDEDCNWRDGAGGSIPALEGCHEVDIFATPFTNTLPIRRLGLANTDPRPLLDQAEIEEQVEALRERGDVSEVAPRNHDPPGHLPVELLDDLDAHRLLTFDTQAVHRIGEVDSVAIRDLLDDLHAAVEVRVQGEDDGAVGYGLDQLGDGNLSARQEHDRWNPGGGGVG